VFSAVVLAALCCAAACGRTPLDLASEPERASDAASAVDATSSGGTGGRDRDAATPTPDAPSDAVSETSPGASFDAAINSTPIDAGAACVTAPEPYVACGCGCCGGVDPYSVCYYPARGETLQAFVTSEPTPDECSSVGCTEGVAYLCCAAPAKPPLKAEYCADYAPTALDHIYVRMTRAGTCVSLTLVSPAPTSNWPVELTPDWGIESAQRYPCDASLFPERAIGAIGAIREAPPLVFQLDLTLFFDVETGVAEPVQLKVDDLIPRGCAP